MKVGDNVWYAGVDFYCKDIKLMKVKLRTTGLISKEHGVVSYYTDKGDLGTINLFPTREEAEAHIRKEIQDTCAFLMNQLKNPAPKERWRNLKNNRVYTVLHVTKDVTENKDTPVVVYALGDEVFVRTVEEFKEKFEEVKG